MRFEVTGEVAAPVDRVWAWWTDYGAEGAVLRMDHGGASSRRRILSVTPEVVELEDASLVGKMRRTIRILPDRRLMETSEGDPQFESEWRFEDAGDGRTRIVRSMRIRSHPAFRPFAQWLVARDLRHHCRQAERELALQPG